MATKTAAKKAAPKKAAPKKPKYPTGAALRKEIVKWAHWFHLHGRFMPYTEGPDRADWLHEKIGIYPVNTDCSGFVTLCYAWAGGHDPNGLNDSHFHSKHWTQLGYTGTLLEHAHEHGEIFTDVTKAHPGDLIVVGPGTGEHVMLVVEAGDDPLCVSHGSEGVWYVRASQDTRTPHRVCQYIK